MTPPSSIPVLDPTNVIVLRRDILTGEAMNVDHRTFLMITHGYLYGPVCSPYSALAGTLYGTGLALVSPNDRGPSPNGFLYHTPAISDSYQSLRYVTPTNANIIAARHNDDRDVMIRIITAGGEGHNVLRIVKKICTGEESLLSHNHALSLLDIFEYNDLTFGVFPRVADLFLSNFLLEWHPNTLDPGMKRRGFTRPRVYIIDFETAVDFLEDSTPEERVVTEYPFPLESYGRPVPPEFHVSNTYDPFTLDIWQFGSDLTRFRSTIWEIDEILESTRNENPRIVQQR
ncbi:uncharacterized protein EV420DRAFT_1651474 [Desarmillaria tabescens]|uniref:Uncharacterized protein n=1 Tax=Armillaria tabescens TaxID=1929756 RepID=A0AA39J9S3_ARMTA|nr:uncharacterized protein EV420DRAFT_1651474 [Desarmillaria tabescens]KAK0438329.1 hypothetical protein EV420DRAFT_1651474 [Desarmillaria tabescens]